MKKIKIGAFCKTYGATMENRVMEHLLENQDLDLAVGDMAIELEISRPKAYQVIAGFEKRGYVVKSRVIGKTQLHKLNKDNLLVKIFLRNFEECLQLVIKEYSRKKPSITAPFSIGAVSAKPF